MFGMSNVEAIKQATKGQVIHIVAKDMHNGIGMENELPWDYREDLHHFACLTSGKDNLYMGYNTYLSLLEVEALALCEELLPGRIVNVVLTRPLPEDVEVKKGVVFCDKSVLNRVITQDKTPVVIIGGASLYQAYPPDIVFATEIQEQYPCDTFYYHSLEGYTKFRIRPSNFEPVKYYMYCKGTTV